MAKERAADFLETLGLASKQLFARDRKTGHRISARKFYGLPGKDRYRRGDYVLMTTRAARPDETPRLL